MESGKCCNICYQTQRKWIKVDWYCPVRLAKLVLLNTSGYRLISTSTSTPNEGFFRDSSKLCIAWSIILRLILIECLRYWLLHALALSCRSRGRMHSVNNLGGLCVWEQSPALRIPHMYVNFPYNSKDNKNTMQVYLVTDMTHVIALEAGQSSQGHLSLSHRSSW